MKFLKEKSNYNQAVKILFIFDNLAKVINFAKNIIITSALGFSKIPDAFNLSRSINGTFYNTISSAMLAGTLPYLNEREDVQEKINFLYSLILVIIGIFGVLSIFIVWNFSNIIDLLAPGFEEDQKRLVYLFFLLQLPMSLITVFTNGFESYFRSEKIFGITNVTKFFVSVISFLLVMFFIKKSYYALAWGPLVGTIISFVYFMSMIPKKMTRFDRSVFSVIKFALPLVLGGSFTIINSFVDKGFSSILPEGQLTNLDLSMKLALQVKSLVSGPLVGALYSFLSIAISKKNYDDAQKQLNDISDLQTTIFSFITILYLLVGKNFLGLIFHHGLVSSEDIDLLYNITLISLPVCYSYQNILVLVLYSFKRSRFVSLGSVLATLLNISLNFYFVKIFGIYALASSTLLVTLLNAFFTSWYAKRRFELVTYRLKHFILIFSVIFFSYLIIIFNVQKLFVVTFSVIILLELVLLKFITRDKINKLMKKIRR